VSRLAERLCASRITHRDQEGLTLPRGATKVDGGMGRSEVNVLGGDVSFFGFGHFVAALFAFGHGRFLGLLPGLGWRQW